MSEIGGTFASMGRRNRRIPNLERMQLTDIGNKGKAVGRHQERVVFVTGGVPGDVVDVQVTKKRRNYLEGKVIKVHEYGQTEWSPHANTLGFVAVVNGKTQITPNNWNTKKKRYVENLKKIVLFAWRNFNQCRQ